MAQAQRANDLATEKTSAFKQFASKVDAKTLYSLIVQAKQRQKQLGSETDEKQALREAAEAYL